MLTSKTRRNLNKWNGKKELRLLRQLTSEILPTEKMRLGAKIFLRSKRQYYYANKGFQALTIIFKLRSFKKIY